MARQTKATLKGAYVVGTDEVIRNLNREIGLIKGRSRRGIAKACLLVRGESQKLVPVVTGNLRGSAFTDTEDTPRGPVGTVGYSAEYAAQIHEDAAMEKRRAARRGTKHDPGPVRLSRVGQWKFLETALKANVAKILELIRGEARVR